MTFSGDQYGDRGSKASSVSPSAAPVPATKPIKQSPQSSVDQFWKKFTTKFPGKVHNVLPSDIYAKKKAFNTPKGTVNGQRAVKSYDQAALECKHAVEKIARENRRINHKYRDQHFDIEFDLKRWPNPRDCLDGLGYVSQNHSPKSVKRVSEVFRKPQFYIEGASASDVRQGFNGDCWLLSALCAISNKKHLIDKICVARDEKVGVYGFVFHRDGEWFHTVVDDKLYLTAADWWESYDEEKRIFENVNRQEAEEKYQENFQKGSRALYFAQCREENETWLPLLEKAFAKAHGDYSAIDGGFTGEAIEDLTGGVTTELFSSDILDKDQFWDEEIKRVNEAFLFSCATGTFDKWQESDVASDVGARSGIIRMHAYSIMDAVEKRGQRLVKVRNPWGSDEWRGAWSDGSEQWTAEWMKILDHKFGDDGVFWISYDDLLKKYSSFERTRLFDESWSITQQWTTVDVPWSADYNDTKFTVAITKQSPVVIVLSQLDDRYFKGFEGQYSFQLHFRLDKDGEEDYIVRSHGNYSMQRSVSIDLDELEPGTYSVLMRITAKRFPRSTTPQKLIQESCADRPNKLIQIGLSYDLAHAKGEIVETEEEKETHVKLEAKMKATTKKKQREDVSARRKKDWEFNKKMRARNQRHDKKRKEYQKRMAEKHDNANRSADDDQNNFFSNGGTISTPSSKGEVEKQAAAGAEAGNNKGGSCGDAANLPTPPAENRTEEGEASVAVNDAGVNRDSAAAVANGPEQSQKKLPPTSPEIPVMAVNDAPPPQAQPGTDLAPPSRPASVIGADNDYLYDSDASYQSSIDSVLDLPEDLPDPPPKASVVGEGDDSDAEIEKDPWNAVCVVGLRVYSKDEDCCIKVVRPRSELGEEEAGLEVDDVSKGISEEKEDPKGIDSGPQEGAEKELKGEVSKR